MASTRGCGYVLMTRSRERERERERGSGVYERSRSSAYKLEEHSQQGLVKDGNHLEGAEVAAQNRSEWRRSVAQCIHLDAG